MLAWWRHQMDVFLVSLALCAGSLPVTVIFPKQRPVTRSVDVFFDLCLNKRQKKQSRRLWFETPSSSLWCHCNGMNKFPYSRKQTRGNEFIPRSNHICHILKCFHSFRLPALPFYLAEIIVFTQYHSITLHRQGKLTRSWSSLWRQQWRSFRIIFHANDVKREIRVYT